MTTPKMFRALRDVKSNPVVPIVFILSEDRHVNQ